MMFDYFFSVSYICFAMLGQYLFIHFLQTAAKRRDASLDAYRHFCKVFTKKYSKAKELVRL